jgi:cell wall-associated NlpC family hydrolase
MGFGGSLRIRAGSGALLAAAAVLALAASSAAAPPTLKDKEAQARAVLAQVNALDIQEGRSVEAWNGAKYELSLIEKQEAVTARQLKSTRLDYRAAEQRASARLVAIYESSNPTVIDAVLGATTLSAMLDRLQAIHATTALDRRIGTEVRLQRDKLDRQAHALAVAHERKAQTVTALAQRRQEIDSELQHRKQLLSTIQGEVAHLRAVERARQARLAEEARKRLAAEQAAVAAAAARLKAAQAAAAAAAAKASKSATTGTPTATPTPGVTTTATTTSADPAAATTTTTTVVAAPVPPNNNPGHPEAASIALKYLGIPYVWGGGSPDVGFDCSGLVMYVYAQIGISLPHFAAAQFGMGTPVAEDQLQPGDLVFFDNLNHVGISLGGNQFVEAPHTGDVVKIQTITGWYANTYVGARRL